MTWIFDKASYWKILLIFFPLWFIFGAGAFRFLSYGSMEWNLIVKVSATFSILFSLMMCGIIYLARKSRNFFDEASKVEDSIKKAKTKEELKKAVDELPRLRKLAFHESHYWEVSNLSRMITMKLTTISEMKRG